jgi:hypothetical protein
LVNESEVVANKWDKRVFRREGTIKLRKFREASMEVFIEELWSKLKF